MVGHDGDDDDVDRMHTDLVLCCHGCILCLTGACVADFSTYMLDIFLRYFACLCYVFHIAVTQTPPLGTIKLRFRPYQV